MSDDMEKREKDDFDKALKRKIEEVIAENKIRSEDKKGMGDLKKAEGDRGGDAGSDSKPNPGIGRLKWHEGRFGADKAADEKSMGDMHTLEAKKGHDGNEDLENERKKLKGYPESHIDEKVKHKAEMDHDEKWKDDWVNRRMKAGPNDFAEDGTLLPDRPLSLREKAKAKAQALEKLRAKKSDQQKRGK